LELVGCEHRRRLEPLRPAFNPNQFDRILVREFLPFRTLKDRVHQESQAGLLRVNTRLCELLCVLDSELDRWIAMRA
jgi:hypothetical protein